MKVSVIYTTSETWAYKAAWVNKPDYWTPEGEMDAAAFNLPDDATIHFIILPMADDNIPPLIFTTDDADEADPIDYEFV